MTGRTVVASSSGVTQRRDLGPLKADRPTEVALHSGLQSETSSMFALGSSAPDKHFGPSLTWMTNTQEWMGKLISDFECEEREGKMALAATSLTMGSEPHRVAGEMRICE